MESAPEVTDVQVWTGKEMFENIDRWYPQTKYIRKKDLAQNIAGCPRLNQKHLKLFSKKMKNDETFRVYNVYANWTEDDNAPTDGLVAFLILYEDENDDGPFVYIDFACAYYKVRRVMKVFLEKLKNSGKLLRLDAVVEPPLRGLRFWFQQGFRTGNAAVDSFLERNLPNAQFRTQEDVEEFETFLKTAEAFDFKEDYHANRDLLAMKYP